MGDAEMLVVENFTEAEKARIFGRIQIDPDTQCWNWMGGKDHAGYGCVMYHKVRERTHRVLYAWKFGPIPKGSAACRELQLDHLCRNTSCCNPDHMKLVDGRTNILRGTGPTAIAARKTHCKYGHPLPDSGGKPRRYCKVCDSLRHKKRLEGPNREYWLRKSCEATKRWYLKKKLAREQ